LVRPVGGLGGWERTLVEGRNRRSQDDASRHSVACHGALLSLCTGTSPEHRRSTTMVRARPAAAGTAFRTVAGRTQWEPRSPAFWRLPSQPSPAKRSGLWEEAPHAWAQNALEPYGGHCLGRGRLPRVRGVPELCQRALTHHLLPMPVLQPAPVRCTPLLDRLGRILVLAPAPPQGPAPYGRGTMFLFMRNRFSGSHRVLTSTRRP